HTFVTINRPVYAKRAPAEAALPFLVTRTNRNLMTATQVGSWGLLCQRPLAHLWQMIPLMFCEVLVLEVPVADTESCGLPRF
ncbi:MAG: hypothetical protein WB662_17755, partial [Methyloceanibacter sp.]